MKIKLTIMAVIIGVLALALTSCNIKFGVESRNENNNEEVVNQSISIENIENIDISIGAANIYINEIDGNELTIDFIGESNLQKNTTVKKSGDKIELKEEKYRSEWKWRKSALEDRKVTIGIPSSYTKNLSLEYGVGNVIVTDINVSELNVEGGAGNLDIKNILFSSLDLEQGVGNTDIDLKEKCGDIKIQGGVGELTLRMSEVGGDLAYEGGVGETDIYIPDKSPVRIKTSSGLGDANINASTSGENTYEFDLSIGIGSLSVN
ncbi:DUF4097 family beta strand repeat-containing protein [Clostridium gasigenes]|uniref:DUF4097 family beta strand repeat-containing protein n=1 Tax=Clostridium gasigenes TaxID=94869 RepID=UPI001C0C4B96|nr:DUF4097 family beta strand repeat-containing protein [Clostridium gasigenes]MBU3103131.1 DUF4097 domain-containing protein [Clostridium gasigenes]